MVSKNQLGKLAVCVTITFWSIGNLIVRGTELTGPQIAFWRYLIAAILYSVGHTIFVGPLRWADFKVAAPMGMVLAVEIALFFMAIKQTTVANVTVIGSLTPLLLFGVAAKRFDERVSPQVIGATVLALFGVAAVVLGSSSGGGWSPAGDGLAVGALIFFAAYFALGKAARETLSGITLQTHSLIAGVPVLALFFLVDSSGLPVPSGGQWWYVFGLIAFPSTGHFLVNWAHAHVSLSLVSLMTLGVPVLSVLGAALLYDESLVALQVGGIVVVLVVLSYAIVETSRLDSAPEREADDAGSTALDA